MFLPLDVWVAAGVVASHVLLYLLDHVMDQDPRNMSYETAFRNRCGYQTSLSHFRFSSFLFFQSSTLFP